MDTGIRTLVFTNSTTSQNILVPIVDDNEEEPTKSFEARLISTVPQVVIASDTATIILLDDDGM